MFGNELCSGDREDEDLASELISRQEDDMTLATALALTAVHLHRSGRWRELTVREGMGVMVRLDQERELEEGSTADEEWVDAEVTKARGDGTFDILYEDGIEGHGVPSRMIRLPDGPRPDDVSRTAEM